MVVNAEQLLILCVLLDGIHKSKKVCSTSCPNITFIMMTSTIDFFNYLLACLRCRSVSPSRPGSPSRAQRIRSSSRSRRIRSRFIFVVFTHVEFLGGIWHHNYKINFRASLLKIELFFFRSHEEGDASNPGNNLYVTGLSARVTSRELEKYFSSEGKVPAHLFGSYWNFKLVWPFSDDHE